MIKDKKQFIIPIVASVLFIIAVVFMQAGEENFGGIKKEHKLKVKKEDIIFERTVKYMDCDHKKCEDKGDMKEYFYKGEEVKAKKASDLLTPEELVTHGLNPDMPEIVSKRTPRYFAFQREDGRMTYVIRQENKLTKENGKWYKVERATTTPESFESQTSLRGVSVAYAKDFTPATKVDGYVRNSGNVYVTVQGATAGNTNDSTGNVIYTQNALDEGGGTYYIDRGIYLFDTSFLGGTVESASFKCYGAYQVADAGNDSYRLVTSNPVAEISLSNYDFDQLGTTAGASDIAIASFTNGDWNTWTMNATGRGWVDVDGTTKLGIRSVLDIAATQPGASDDVIGCASVETATDPTLTVTIAPLSIRIKNQPVRIKGNNLN